MQSVFLYLRAINFRMMKVYKFGGASVSTIERIKQTADILRAHKEEKILVVISAMGKTTNALEKVAEAFFDKRNPEALQLFEAIKEQHIAVARQLLSQTLRGQYDEAYNRLFSFFTEIEWLLHDKPVQSYDYYYDQIVCIGELLSTAIMSAYFEETGIANTWIDVRDILRTDDIFRAANIDWKFSQQQVDTIIKPLFLTNNIVVTQGFIAATDENESTTLGREGSDYTAAVFANMLDTKSLTVWKDVPGIMSADPAKDSNATVFDTLTYQEMTEISHNGAKVIHPKTIKPLQDKDIPMFVKCFLDYKLPGTVISNGH